MSDFLVVGKQESLPHKSPDVVASETPVNSKEDCSASLDGLSFEEQPAWLDELLNEPELPFSPRSHRRSASDSAAYINTMKNTEKGLKLLSPGPLWVLHNIDHRDGIWQWNSPVNAGTFCSFRNGCQFRTWETPNKKGSGVQKPGMSNSFQEQGASSSRGPMKNGKHAKDGFMVKTESHQANSAAMTDAKRSKQQNANRARERRHQYIAGLERNVQMLQAEGYEVSFAIGFLGRKNLLLSIENRTLKDRLDSLAKVQKLKEMEQHMLEREIGRLQFIYQRQQKQPQPRPQGRELESQLTTLAI